jgi:cyclase
MRNIRLIARLDIKNYDLIKGINLEGLRVIGPASEFALKYYLAGADELIFMDSVASLYRRKNISEILESAVENVFIPITVGGGIRTLADAKRLLRSGADKVAINSAAVKRPELISEIAQTFGSQAMVLSVEARKDLNGSWEVLVDGGREKTGLDVKQWITTAVSLGVGEILLTSVNQEGTRKGFDIELTKTISQIVGIPIIASGGMGSLQDFRDVVTKGGADAVAIASVLHYNSIDFKDIRAYCSKIGLKVRSYE